jgi:predicted amidohydrolase
VAQTAESEIVFMAGLNERCDGGVYNSVIIAHRGMLLGVCRKTMLTGSGHREMGFATDFDVRVWRARGLTFGIIICADSSYIEVAQTLWWQGAQLIFSPHHNFIASEGMDRHRIRVRNNHIGIAALLGVPVVRSNVVNWDRAPRLGYGDSAIFDDSGRPLAEAGLFTECVIEADIDFGKIRPFETRHRIPMALRRQLADAILAAPVAEF